jgi:hypothetical protein
MKEKMFAESKHDYFTNAFDDQIAFVSDAGRKVREVVRSFTTRMATPCTRSGSTRRSGAWI